MKGEQIENEYLLSIADDFYQLCDSCHPYLYKNVQQIGMQFLRNKGSIWLRYLISVTGSIFQVESNSIQELIIYDYYISDANRQGYDALLSIRQNEMIVWDVV